MNKKERRNLIQDIISKQIIQTQTDLVIQLNRKGNSVTQATVSRDIKEMHLIKIPFEENKYRYSMPFENKATKLYQTINESVINVYNHDIFVFIITLPGSGPTLSDLIDKVNYKTIFFTISNDNKVMIACNNKEDAYEIKEKFYKEAHK